MLSCLPSYLLHALPKGRPLGFSVCASALDGEHDNRGDRPHSIQAMSSKAPAFQFYAKDHIATLAKLTDQGKVAWVILVSHCWEHGGPLPIELATHLVGEKGLESVRFETTNENGHISFGWQEELRQKMAERSAKNAANGKMGGRGNRRGSKERSERKADRKRTHNEKKPFRAEVANAVQEERVVEKERARTIDDRREAFEAEVNEANNGSKFLPSLEVVKFIRYWTEPDRGSKPKMRFEKQATWSTEGRLATWRDNYRSRHKPTATDHRRRTEPDRDEEVTLGKRLAS